MNNGNSECVDHGRKGFGLGYATAWLQGKTTTLHRRVHFEHTGEMPEVVRHTCDNARCINPKHLISGTQLDNVTDMYERNRAATAVKYGEANGNTTITTADVEYIRHHYKKGSREFGLPALARRFGCGTSQLHRIIRGTSRTSDAKGTTYRTYCLENAPDQSTRRSLSGERKGV